VEVSQEEASQGAAPFGKEEFLLLQFGLLTQIRAQELSAKACLKKIRKGEKLQMPSL
jgi:hypothetical protein